MRNLKTQILTINQMQSTKGGRGRWEWNDLRKEWIWVMY